jgi:hypothetical protein
MQHPDHSLIYRARKFMTAENVHRVNTWIFCYFLRVPVCFLRLLL